MLEALLNNSNVVGPPAPPGQVKWISAGNYTWECPPGVTEVSCVVISAGESSKYPSSANIGTAGSGGGVRWKNNIPVIPGKTYSVIVGNRADSANINLAYTGVYNPNIDYNTSVVDFGLTVGITSIGTSLGNGVGGGYGATGSSITGDGAFTLGAPSASFTNGTVPRVNGVSRNTGDGITLDGVPTQVTTGQTYPGDGAFCGGGAQARNAVNASGTKYIRRGGSGGVKIIWGSGRAYPSTRITDE